MKIGAQVHAKIRRALFRYKRPNQKFIADLAKRFLAVPDCAAAALTETV